MAGREGCRPFQDSLPGRRGAPAEGWKGQTHCLKFALNVPARADEVVTF